MKVLTFFIENPESALISSSYSKKDFAGTEYIKEYPKGRFHAFIKGKQIKLHYDKLVGYHHVLTSNVGFLVKERKFIKSNHK